MDTEHLSFWPCICPAALLWQQAWTFYWMEMVPLEVEWWRPCNWKQTATTTRLVTHDLQNEVIGLAQTNCQQSMGGSCLSKYVHEGLSTLPLLAFSRLATSAGGRPPSQPDPYKANMANIKLLFVTLCAKRAFTRLAWSFGVQGSQGKTKTKGWLIKARQFGPFFWPHSITIMSSLFLY